MPTIIPFLAILDNQCRWSSRRDRRRWRRKAARSERYRSESALIRKYAKCRFRSDLLTRSRKSKKRRADQRLANGRHYEGRRGCSLQGRRGRQTRSILCCCGGGDGKPTHPSSSALARCSRSGGPPLQIYDCQHFSMRLHYKTVANTLYSTCPQNFYLSFIPCL